MKKPRYSPSLPLNRQSAPQVIRLLDYCFKKGVIDAYEANDDYAVKEWLDARKADGGYGLLSEPGTPFDWRRWRFTLFRWCRLCSLARAGEGYIDMIRNRHQFLFAVIPLSMRFYLLGIEEWLAYPNSLNMAIFKQTSRIHWKPMASHLRKMKTDDYISYVQEFIYERVSMALEDDLTPAQYDSFCTALWKYTRKYIPYGEIRDDIEAEEDF